MKNAHRFSGLLFAVIVGVVIGVILFSTSFGKAIHTPKDIAGKWQCTVASESMGTTMLTNAGFSEEELELIQDKSFRYVVLAEFTEQGAYTFSFQYDLTGQNVVSLFEGAFADLYEGRALYGAESMSEAEFQAYYAKERGAASFEALFAELSNYELSGVSEYDSGKFSFKNDEQMVVGSNTARYTLTNDILTLQFSDVTMALAKSE